MRRKLTFVTLIAKKIFFIFLQRSKMSVFLIREAWIPHFWAALIPKAVSEYAVYLPSSIWGGRRNDLTFAGSLPGTGYRAPARLCA
jgi:hypothetical protein